MSSLKTYKLNEYRTESGAQYKNLSTTYQLFGKELHSAPIVLVNHALTGNSDVASDKKGWWKEIIGVNKLIDFNKYTVIAFNILGNGYDDLLIDNYKDFTTKDVAIIFHKALLEIKVKNVFAIIGGSLGGGIAWEMGSLFPQFSTYIIPIATHHKANDWIIAHCAVQESILLNSRKPLQDTRKMAMLFYRTPQSFSKKFNRAKSDNLFEVESWLNHHGNSLKDRFQLKAYLMMNHLLSSINVAPENLSNIKSTVIQISINSDLFFLAEENLKTQKTLNQLKVKNLYHEIKSIDGHDAFLIEHQQITDFLSPIFK
jgi:homoserine O-acetyltransferase